MDRKDVLKSWKSQLTEENKAKKQQLDLINEELIQLRTKKDVLQMIIMQNSGSNHVELFKQESGYDQIAESIRELETRISNVEPDISQKIHFNKIVINEIDQQLD